MFCFKQISKFDTHVSTSIFKWLLKNVIFKSVALVLKKLWAMLYFSFTQTRLFNVLYPSLCIKNPFHYYSLKVIKFHGDSVRSEISVQRNEWRKVEFGRFKINYSFWQIYYFLLNSLNKFSLELGFCPQPFYSVLDVGFKYIYILEIQLETLFILYNFVALCS